MSSIEVQPLAASFKVSMAVAKLGSAGRTRASAPTHDLAPLAVFYFLCSSSLRKVIVTFVLRFAAIHRHFILP